MSSDCLAARIKSVRRAITESAVCSPSARKKTERLSTGDKPMTELKERSFDGEEENRAGGVNAELDRDQRERRGRGDFMGGTKLGDGVNDQFLDEVGAEGNAGNKSRARNFYPRKGQARTEGADEEQGHAERDQQKLPGPHGHSNRSGFLNPKRGNDQRDSREQEPGREADEALPPLRPEFLDRGEDHTKGERIEPRPGGVVDPGLEGAEVLRSEKPAEGQSTDHN